MVSASDAISLIRLSVLASLIITSLAYDPYTAP